MTRSIRAKITGFAGVAPGQEDAFTFSIQYEEGGGIVNLSGVKPEWLPYWGGSIQVDPAKCVGWIVPAQITQPEGRIEVFFSIPPAVADCADQGQPSPGMTEAERERMGIPAVSPSETGNTAPETGGLG
jgi:hypothetical protein